MFTKRMMVLFLMASFSLPANAGLFSKVVKASAFVGTIAIANKAWANHKEKKEQAQKTNVDGAEDPKTSNQTTVKNPF